MTQSQTTRPAFARLARESGAFAMLAIDQREGLRTMIEQQTGRPAADEQLSAFKVAATDALSPHASALLVDTQYGLDPIVDAGVLDPDCGLIIAADRLAQQPGGPVTDATFDDSVDLARVEALDAAALKLLVIWRPDGHRDRRGEEINRFLDACRRCRRLAIVEAVVRPGLDRDRSFDREEALLRAASEIGEFAPDIYKAEVPRFGVGDRALIEERCHAITAAVPCPWVVLSSGVAPDAFPDAVRAACRGGASGFLAGRAIWSTALAARDTGQALHSDSVSRLRALLDVVDEHARPWSAAVAR